MSERDRVMQSTLEVSGALAQYEVTDGEVPANELFTHLILTAREHSSVINLDIILPTERIASERTLLENAGFTFAGTHQLNRDGHSVLLAKFRICVKTAFDGVTTYGNTTLARHRKSRWLSMKSAAECRSL